MAWNDWLYGGGLFGGYGSNDPTSEEARQRANRRGLLTTGALIMGNSVGPNNMGFARNISSALLAGRESFEETLDREARMEAEAERKRKILELEEEERRMKEEAEARRFAEFEMKEGKRTQQLNTLINRTGKSFEELSALDDGTLEGLYEQSLFPKPEKAPVVKIEGGRRIRVMPDGSEVFIDYLPPEPRQPKEPLTPEELEDREFRARERWIQNYVSQLGQDKVSEDIIEDGKPKRVTRPRVATLEERRQMAEDAWYERQKPFYGVRGGGSSTGLAPKRENEDQSLFDSRGGGGPIPQSVRDEIERDLLQLPAAERAAARAFAYSKYHRLGHL